MFFSILSGSQHWHFTLQIQITFELILIKETNFPKKLRVYCSEHFLRSNSSQFSYKSILNVSIAVADIVASQLTKT